MAKVSAEEAEVLKAKAPEHIEEVALARITDENLWKLSQESLSVWSWTGVRLGLIMFVQGCNQAGFGIDWGVISGINALDAWHDYFGFGTSGGTYGLINALMSIGTVCGAPFLSLGDVIGRRGINFLGNAIVIVAAVLQGCAINLPMFMAGRFFMGFGTALMSSSQYIGEISPVHLRGRMVGFFGACFQVGSLAMLGAMIGLSNIPGNNCWRIPLILEAVFPAIVCSTIYFLTPESPRYYVMKGQREKAKQVVAKYHTTSTDINEPIVDIMVTQMEESLEGDRASYRSFWDYRVFFTKIARYRLLVLVLYSIFQQWNGGSIITYYVRTTGLSKAWRKLTQENFILDDSGIRNRRHRWHKTATGHNNRHNSRLFRVHSRRIPSRGQVRQTHPHLRGTRQHGHFPNGDNHHFLAIQPQCQPCRCSADTPLDLSVSDLLRDSHRYDAQLVPGRVALSASACQRNGSLRPHPGWCQCRADLWYWCRDRKSRI